VNDFLIARRPELAKETGPRAACCNGTAVIPSGIAQVQALASEARRAGEQLGMMITGDTTITDATKGGLATEIQTKACRNSTPVIDLLV
jgi:hypothetical protein